jgi:hypothetical protein
MRLHNSCSVPFGFGAVTLPGSFQSSPHQQQHAHAHQQQQQAAATAAAAAPPVASPGSMFGGHQVQWNTGGGGSGGPAPFSFGAPPNSGAPANAQPGGGQFVFGGAHAAAPGDSEMES